MFVNLFKRFISPQVIRAFSNSQRIVANKNKARLFFYSLTGGTTTTFAISLFGSAKQGKTDEKQSKSEFDLMREADLFYDRFRNSENPEMLWRLARVLCEQGKQCKNVEEKKRLFNEALEMADKALKNEYFWGKIGSFGIWHFTFADLPYYSRLAAKAIYGTPPSSSYDEALRHFERAESIHPNFYSANLYYLGQTYERLGQKEKAIEYLKKAFFSPIVTIDDNETHIKVFYNLQIKII